MQLAVHEQAPVQVRAIAFSQLDKLKDWLAKQIDVTRDDDQRSHFVYALSEIARFQEDPRKFRFVEPQAPPPGAPIGMCSDFWH